MIYRKKRPSKYYTGQIDTIEIFFQDVAEIPILAGYADYLPLTRRIERGRHINACIDNATALEITQDYIRDSLQHLLNHIDWKELQTIDYTQWGEIEHFLDDVTTKCPNVIEKFLSVYEEHPEIELIQEHTWKLCYLFSALPATVRRNWDSLTMKSDIDRRFTEIRNEVKQCKHDLTQGTMRYAVNIARLYTNTSIDFADLVQQGLIGLMYASEKYQEFRMTHFQHYASNWIRQQITRYIADHSRLIRIPVHLETEINRIDDFISEHQRIKGNDPTAIEIFLNMGWIEDDDIQIARLGAEHDRYKRIEQTTQHIDTVMKQGDLPLSQVNHKTTKLLEEIDIIISDYKNRTGKTPSKLTIAEKLGLISTSDVLFKQQHQKFKRVSSRKLAQTHSRFHKARKRYSYYLMAKATHYSLETCSSEDDAVQECLHDLLPSGDNVAGDGDRHLLAERVYELMEKYLKPREIDIVCKRFGILDGIEHTLEEIGSEKGLTRERIRQIESRALGKLRQKRSLLVHFLNPISEIRNEPPSFDYEMFANQNIYTNEITDHDPEREYVDKLISIYIIRGRPKRLSSAVPRHVHIEQVLADAGTPLHHKEIYQRVLAKLTPESKLTEKSHYAALFYSDKFYGLGDGVYALKSWIENNYNGQSGKKITHFPEPLRPVESNTTAFFESIIVGHKHLKTQQLTVEQFLLKMQAWAGRSQMDRIDIQNALDAWYTAGLIDRIDFQHNPSQVIVSKLPENSKINDIRITCLNNIAQRVTKIPELLLTLKHIAPASLSDIQKVLFGGAGAGFDVPTRLEVLESFEAIQQDGNLWRITTIGEITLNENPPDDLPDFSIIEEVIQEVESEAADIWEDDLGFVDF